MEHSHEVSPATPTDVYARLIEPGFLTAFSTELGVTLDGITTDIGADPDGDWQQATLLWEFATAGLPIPGAAQRFLGQQVALRWQQKWRELPPGSPDARTHAGELEAVLSGRPGATTKGTIWLKPFGAATLLGTDARTKINLLRPIAAPLEATVDSQLVGWILRVQARVLRRELGLPPAG
ncbi:MAG: DUF2505 family protein [Candidatus Nanopelagicales bacterium]